MLSTSHRPLTLACLLLALQAAPLPAGESGLQLPAGIGTHPDGRQPLAGLYKSYLGLVEQGWTLEVVADSRPPGTAHALPIIALRSPRSGPAVWFLSGIHGEEPAGPNAIAAAIAEIAALGSKRPVVLLPLLNPHGYARNWRYLNVATYSELVDGHSVGDSSHLLPSPGAPGSARAPSASSPEADAITRFVLRRSADYPPFCSIDLHEDNLIDEGYVYSQGALGAADPLATEAVKVLRDNGIQVKMNGKTRFGEEIVSGIIGPVVDSSIDELMGSHEIVSNGRIQPGPAARTVLVFETPAAELSLGQRIDAHAALIRRLTALVTATGD